MLCRIFAYKNLPLRAMDNCNNSYIGKILALKSLREEFNELSEQMQELAAPILNDLSYLPWIYTVFTEHLRRNGRTHDAGSVYNRKKFLMAVLYLYSPRALAGDRMRMGLRKRISELFKLSSSTPISDNCAGLIVLYSRYSDFRKDVDAILGMVLKNISPSNGLAKAPGHSDNALPLPPSSVTNKKSATQTHDAFMKSLFD